MDQMPNCPKCQSEYVYHDSINFVCPDCGNEWDNNEIQESDDDQLIVKDSNGNLLAEGDNVLLIKDLKLKGSSEVLKKGTKFKNIRLVNGDHNVDCGKIMLKSACTGCGKCEQACVLEEAAIKILPMDLAKGMLGKHYRLGWEEKAKAGHSLAPKDMISLPTRTPEGTTVIPEPAEPVLAPILGSGK